MLALSTINKIRDGHPASNYATSSCLFPKRVKIRLSETGDYTDIYCDCGKCLRCCDNKRNDWAARMFLHSLDYEYVYFVTLTYGSYNLLPFDKHPFLADWIMSVPVYDSFNSNNKPAWTPSILCQSHLTKYIKRLRVSLKSQITYAACGEYGGEYGRPHFHLIIWSHQFISPEQFSNAWSLECKRTDNNKVVRPWRETKAAKDKAHGYFRFRIGRVDVHDLWANGSLNFNGKHPGVSQVQDKSKNAMYNFTYLAKYIGKNDPVVFTSNMPTQVMSRIQTAYYMLTQDIDSLAAKFPIKDNSVTDIEDYAPSDSRLITFNHLKNSIHYDYQDYRGIDYLDFKKMVAPFFVASRRPSIGKPYFLKNRAKFLIKEYGLPSFMGKSINFPAYFTRLLCQEKYSLRLRKVTPSGVSLTKDLFPRLYDYMEKLYNDSNYWFAVRGFSKTSSFLWHDRAEPRYELYSLSGDDEHGQLDSVDMLDASDGVIHYYYNPYQEIFEGWRFNPSSRGYTYVNYYDRLDFCDMVMTMIENEVRDYPYKYKNMQERFDLANTILEDPYTQVQKDLFVEQRAVMQTKYKLSKQTYGL